jgi:hypothetical protein
MKYYRNLLLAILLAPLASNAQLYQPGKVVNMKGDTLSGLIEYAEWIKNPKSIRFKLNPGAPVQKLSPADTRFFSVSVGHLAEFVAYAGRVSTDYTDVDHLQAVLDTSSKIDTIFLKVVQDGKNVELFSYTDDQKTRFFIAAGFSAKPVELIYHAYLKADEANGANRTIYQTDFKQQLYDAAVKSASMSPELETLISKSEFNEQDLLQIAGKINNISTDDVSKTNATKAKPSHVVFAVAAAGAIIFFLILEMSRIHNSP